MPAYASNNQLVRIIDACKAAESLAKQHQPIPPEFAYANSVMNPLGRESGRAWILLSRASLDTFNLNGYTTITFKDDDGNTFSAAGLVFLKAQNLTPSYLGDPNALYLCEFADTRWLCHNPSWSIPCTLYFNVRAGGWGGDYYTESTNSGTAWTWTGMVEELWSLLTAQLGDYPGLPFTPNGTPENWIFPGVPAWMALCEVLERIGCAVRRDPSANTYAIVRVGGDDTTTDNLLAALETSKKLLLNREYIEGTAGRIPAFVKVLFHAVNIDSGTELTTPLDGNWLDTSFYNVDVTAVEAGALTSLTGVDATSAQTIWDDLPALYDAANALTNESDLETRALERATDYYRQLQAGGARLHKVYLGIWNLQLSNTLKGVAWRQNEQGAFVTEIVRHPLKYLRPEAGQWVESADWPSSSPIQPPKLGPGYPVYPQLPQMVRCATSEATADDQYDAWVQNLDDADTPTWEDQERVWLIEPNGGTLAEDTIYYARLVGFSNDRPVYATVVSEAGWIPCYNDGDETLPAYGVAIVTGLDPDLVTLLVDVPDEYAQDVVYLGPTDIPPGETGTCRTLPPDWIAYDEDDGLPTPGEMWGVAADQTELRRNHPGFFVVDSSSGLARVIPHPGDNRTGIVKTNETIPALTDGVVPGSGLATPQWLDTSLSAILTDVNLIGEPTEITVYNCSDVAVAAGKFVSVVREPISGKWFITVGPLPAEATLASPGTANAQLQAWPPSMPTTASTVNATLAALAPTVVATTPGIALVQTGSGTSAPADTTVDGTWSGATTTGNFLVAVVISSNSAAAAEITSITPPSGWTEAKFIGDAGIAYRACAIFYKENAASQSTTGDFTISAASSGAVVVLAEYSGLRTASSLDKTQSNGEATGSGTFSTGTTPTTTQNDELVICGYSTGSNAHNNDPTNGFSIVIQQTNVGAGGNVRATMTAKIVSTTGTQQSQITGTSQRWCAAIATFKAATT